MTGACSPLYLGHPAWAWDLAHGKPSAFSFSCFGRKPFAMWTLSPEVDAQHQVSNGGLDLANLSSINCSALLASEGAVEICFCVYK